MDFTKLKERMDNVASHWNGEESGRAEERAQTALEVLEKVKEIEELLNYLEEN